MEKCEPGGVGFQLGKRGGYVPLDVRLLACPLVIELDPDLFGLWRQRDYFPRARSPLHGFQRATAPAPPPQLGHAVRGTDGLRRGQTELATPERSMCPSMRRCQTRPPM